MPAHLTPITSDTQSLQVDYTGCPASMLSPDRFATLTATLTATNSTIPTTDTEQLFLGLDSRVDVGSISAK
jgi:hypothetical protein